MSVDYYACEVCGETFPDCGPCGNCAGCGGHLCSDCQEEMGDKYGTVEEDSELADEYGDSASLECDECSKSIIRDSDVVFYLLSKVDMTKDEVIAAIKLEREEI